MTNSLKKYWLNPALLSLLTIAQIKIMIYELILNNSLNFNQVTNLLAYKSI